GGFHEVGELFDDEGALERVLILGQAELLVDDELDGHGAAHAFLGGRGDGLVVGVGVQAVAVVVDGVERLQRGADVVEVDLLRVEAAAAGLDVVPWVPLWASLRHHRLRRPFGRARSLRHTSLLPRSATGGGSLPRRASSGTRIIARACRLRPTEAPWHLAALVGAVAVLEGLGPLGATKSTGAVPLRRSRIPSGERRSLAHTSLLPRSATYG